MIVGWFDKGHPTVVGALSIDTLGYAHQAAFLADTGSYVTLLHPGDGQAGKLPYPTLPLVGKANQSLGLGAKASSYLVPAVLYLARTDGLWQPIQLDIAVAIPTPHNRTFPSILGWDVLQYFCMVSNRSNNIVQLRTCSLPTPCNITCV
jgi:hypothetical protein